jgi:hemerythrin-like domain-containing protein
MKITDALLGEHGVLYDLFGHLRDVAMSSGDATAIRAAFAVVERLLLAHARVEEELLFPILQPHVGHMGPIGVMLAEHRRIDALLEAAREESDPSSLKNLAGQLIELASGHFRKEESVLFGMAEQYLGDELLTELGEQWAASRNVTLGGGGCMAFG